LNEAFGRLLPHLVTPPPGPVSRWLAEELAKFESPNVTYLADDFPVFWSEARGANVKDVDGNIYVDMTAAFAVAAAGHSHPEIVAAVRDQAGRLMHGMGDVHPPAIKVELLRRLAGIAPGNLSRTILANSGAEAVEAALKTAMLATGKSRVLAFSGGYHGLTLGTLAVAGRDDFREPFARQLGASAVLVPYPYPYRSAFPGHEDECAVALAAIEEALDRAEREGGDVGAILAEPIQGRGGVLVPPDPWLPGLRRICDERDLLLILDEIYTGFGRTGRWFACEHWDVVPDLLLIGKALTGGMPFAACIGTEAVMSAWPRSKGEALHTSTFLGHPLGCAAALASMRVIESEGLVERSRMTGTRLLARLRGLLADHPRVGEVRGVGMMIGIELVCDRSSRLPDGVLATRLVGEMLRRGYLLLGGGTHGNVLTFSPPLSTEEDLLEGAVIALGEAMGPIG
jgi:4-aminobutyrate aminotransferase / (S)-3-amino-2-methylpropionate transaminase / 5-aminovalerate transaminase